MIGLKPLAFALALLVSGMGGLMAAPAAFAAAADVALLKEYVGEWRGRGVLRGAEQETVVCRLTLSPGNQDRVTFAGRCALAGTNMSIRGTIAYNDSSRRYEAAMTSDVGFSPESAVGRRQGNDIVFTLNERQADGEGNMMQISATLALKGSQQIDAEFKIVFLNTGDQITAAVPFTK